MKPGFQKFKGSEMTEIKIQIAVESMTEEELLELSEDDRYVAHEVLFSSGTMRNKTSLSQNYNNPRAMATSDLSHKKRQENIERIMNILIPA